MPLCKKVHCNSAKVVSGSNCAKVAKKCKVVRVVLRQCGWKLILLFDQLADYGRVQNYAGASDQRDNKLQNNGHLSEQILHDRRNKRTVRKYVIISGQLLQAWGC